MPHFFSRADRIEHLRHWLDAHIDDYLKDNIRVRGYVDTQKLATDIFDNVENSEIVGHE